MLYEFGGAAPRKVVFHQACAGSSLASHGIRLVGAGGRRRAVDTGSGIGTTEINTIKCGRP